MVSTSEEACFVIQSSGSGAGTSLKLCIFYNYSTKACCTVVNQKARMLVFLEFAWFLSNDVKNIQDSLRDEFSMSGSILT